MADGKKATIFSRDVVLVMAAAFFFMFSNMYCNPLINGYAKSLGASSTFAGVIVGMMSIVAMFLRPIAGNLTDRFSKYQLSVAGGLLSFIGVLGYVFTPNSGLLLFFRLVNGLGYVLCTVCMTTWLSYLVPFSHVGEAMSFYGLMNALAMSLAPAISIDLYRVIGYRLAIVISAISALLVVVTIQFVSNRAVPDAAAAPGRRRLKIIQRDSLPVAALIALFALPYFATQADIVSYVEQRHLDVAVGAYFLIYAVVLLAIRLVLRNQFDTVRFGVWLVGCAVATVFYLVMLAVMENNWEMALAAAGMALGYGIIYSVCQSTAMMLAPANERGLASATFFVGLDIGMSLGPIVGGIIDSVLPVKDFYLVMLLIVPVILLIYLANRRKLNRAVIQHQEDIN
ncbi:MFS transporter [Limosilactobacillus antri]|uniref:Major facilitator superfamily MFS 1 transporter n=1 Tax=Limosilactobacillus antri DSM 16041 TaxID=525309 RepID=C8P4W2_9LACO|nr:MFS transporter [Limosilactobacillus antri]EEW54468.1 transporter, major facilitator family protein [Limosilactobacillus antri DSM 16041]KRK60135.1 major facilitator superfamily MFS 1 transporter [Limosilactobacillus antri DSM 16041]